MMFSRHYFYHDLSQQQPRIAISACLMGDAVRYDGQDKSSPVLAGFLQTHTESSKVCPEMGAGLGVPRPPVALQKTDKGIEALGIHDTRLNVTAALTDFSEQFTSEHENRFQAIVVKSRSPSCGFGSTPILEKQQTSTGNGIFAHTLHRQWPDCLIVEETALVTVADCEDFLFRCYLLLDIAQTSADEMALLQRHYLEHYQHELSLQNLACIDRRHYIKYSD